MKIYRLRDTSGQARIRVNPEDFCVGLSQRIVDALAVGAGYPEETSPTNPSSGASYTASLPRIGEAPPRQSCSMVR